MKILKLCVALGLVLAVSGTASALSFSQSYTGPIEIKFQNWDMGTVYTDLVTGGPAITGDANMNDEQQIMAPGAWLLDGSRAAVEGTDDPDIIEDKWGILRVTSILTAGGAELWQSGSAGEELTGIYWGEIDRFAYQDIVGVGGGAQVHQYIAGVSMHFAVFEDPNKDLLDYLTDVNDRGTLPASNRTGQTSFTGATEGTLLWTFDSVVGFQGSGNADDEFFTDITLTDTGALSTAVGDVWCDMTTNAAGTGELNDWYTVQDPDLKLNFNAIFRDNMDWIDLSDDPVLTHVIPEPMTVLAVTMAFGMLGTYVRKRRA